MTYVCSIFFYFSVTSAKAIKRTWVPVFNTGCIIYFLHLSDSCAGNQIVEGEQSQ